MIERSLRFIPDCPLADLRPFDRNPRKNDAAVEAVEKSLSQFGPVAPIIVDGDFRICAGHTRYKAATQQGLSTFPVLVAPHLVGDDFKAYNIADNQTASIAEWDTPELAAIIQELQDADYDFSVLGFNAEEFNEIMASIDGPPVNPNDPDDVPEPPVDPISKTGDLWLLGSHRLLCGDATVAADLERLMCGEKADCVFTSPPYAVGIDYGLYQDTIDNLRAMLPKLSRGWKYIVRDGGYAVINFGDIVSARDITGTTEPCEYPMALEYFPIFRADGWLLWSRRIWCKPCSGTGSMQCISSNRAATNWEHIWTWKLPGPPLHRRQTTGDHPSQQGWFDTTHSHRLDIGLDVHGAGMPVAPALFCIDIHSFIDGIVHEPFAGTGTTVIACEQLGRKCYAMEIEPKYVDVAVKRWEQFTGKQAELAR